MASLITAVVAGVLAAHDYTIGLTGWAILDLMIVGCVVGASYFDNKARKIK